MTQPIQPFIVNDYESILTKLSALKKQFEHLHLNELFAQDDQSFEKVLGHIGTDRFRFQ